MKFYHNLATATIDLEFNNGVYRFIVLQASAVIIKLFENDSKYSIDDLKIKTNLKEDEIKKSLDWI